MEMDFPATPEQLEALDFSLDLDDNHIELVLQTKKHGELIIKFPKTRPDYAAIMYATFATTTQLACVQSVLKQCNINDEVSSGVIKLFLVGAEVDQRQIFNDNTNAENPSNSSKSKTIDLSSYKI